MASIRNTIQIVSCIALCGALGGCWNAKQIYTDHMAEGKARNVPLLIYYTSWNDPHALYNVPMVVDLVNTGNQEIKSVTLLMQDCGSQGIESDVHSLTLIGPYAPGRTYIIHPSWPVQYSQWISRRQAEDAAKTIDHMVIVAVEIVDSDGMKSTYNNNVSKLLTSSISNFCLNDLPWSPTWREPRYSLHRLAYGDRRKLPVLQPKSPIGRQPCLCAMPDKNTVM